jgi:L-alanine-DL-glutamate epimerase-like enolase superfamily enzyme
MFTDIILPAAHLPQRIECLVYVRIRDIQTTTLRFEYPAIREFDFAGGRCNARVSTLVRVFTDSGLVGLGSVYSHPDIVRTIIEDQLRPILVGEDPADVEALWQRCYSVTRWYGRKGVAVSALGGIDMALWDLRGKAAGLPVYQMLGAKRHRVPAYASGLLWKRDVSELREEAQRHLARGFRGMKMRLGRNYGYDSAALHAVRETIGRENRLMIEGNARYPLDQIRRLAPEFQKAGIFWLEEPFLPECPDSFRQLRPHLGSIPLAAGENEFGLQGFRELMDGHVVDIVQPDACRCGGITESLRVAELAAKHGLRVAPHTWSDAVALTANMHVLASLDHGLTVEVDQTGNPLIEELLATKWNVENGEIAMPEGPGLGISLDESAVERYSLPRGATVPNGNYSDMVFGRQFHAPAPPYEA